MSEYRLDIDHRLGLSDFSTIHDYLGIVSPDDKLTITLHLTDTNNSEMVCRMLETYDFVITTRGHEVGNTLEITAYKKGQ